jgi:Holliday junction resolvase RusA-like endonuclease
MSSNLGKENAMAGEGIKENNKISILIPGEPIAKARPRWARWGMYSPKKTVNYETLIQAIFCEKHRGFIPTKGPVRLEALAYFTIPKSAGKKKSLLMANGVIKPTKRPDADNILKIIADSLQGIAFKNDSQIIEAHIYKLYSDYPRLEISINVEGK